MYKIVVKNRNYTDFNIHDANTFNDVSLEINPLEHKLLNGDVFNLLGNNFELVHSSIRNITSMPGVLILEDNKTYGRQQTSKGLGKLLYRCVPDDIRLPHFLIPYELKKIGFSKVFKNMYVTFSFDAWSGKHPQGKLNEVIGNVDILENFYEYQLYCKSLNASIQKFTKATNESINNYEKHESIIDEMCIKYNDIEDRTDWDVFTIDPDNSMDFDDGFSIKLIDNKNDLADNNININSKKYYISIYIANVTLWLDMLNLWDSFSKRISTIYLPDRKRPMLPNLLSDCLCSLQERTKRIAFFMDFYVDNGEIKDVKYGNAKICVKKNYRYEEELLIKDLNYNNLFNATKILSKNYKYISNIRDSHDVVSYLMILMNYHTAKQMLDKKSGIFRSTIIKKKIDVPKDVPDDVGKFIKIWNSSCGQYIDIANIKYCNNNDNNDEEDFDYEFKEKIKHELMEMDAYIHITSPIRRIVDLLNIIQFQKIYNVVNLSENAVLFYNRWIEQLDYINTTMRAIRKIQTVCNLLDMCTKNNDMLNKTYDGYLFDKAERNDGLFQYMVYLPNIKMMHKITTRVNVDNYSCLSFMLYIFNDEEKFKRKIRIQVKE